MDAFERAVKQLQSGHNAEASKTCRRILRFAPEHADTWNILGLAQVGLAMLDEAAASFERAIALSSDADPCNNLGSLRKQQGRLKEAEAAYRQALERNPDYADAHFNLGAICRDRGELAFAGECFQKSAQANPTDAEAWSSAGAVYLALGEFAVAAACLTKVLELQPESPAATHDLAKAVFNLGYVDEAFTYFQRAARLGPAELPLSMIATIVPGLPGPRGTNQLVLDERRAYAAFLPPQRPSRSHARNCPLRIGYVSSFFHRHNWMKPVWALINRHDRERFAVHLFSDAPLDAIKHGYRPHAADRFHDITGLSNDAAADLVEQAEVGVLVDLNGYSKVRRLGLCALKPAPILVGWFNMYATTGIGAYDYLIGDDTVIPPDEEQFYSERILRLPGSYLTFEVHYPVPDVAPAPFAKNGYITFGSLASQYKITHEVRDAWVSILRAVPNSRLILKNAALGSQGNAKHVRELFGDVADRIRFDGPSDHYEFLKAYDEIDIALDTFPYNGGTTTTEAIWQGVPVMAFWGDRWAARTSASILRAAGLTEYVAADVEGYIAKAIGLANGEPRRLSREQIRDSAACDAEGFARNMEALYLDICRQ
jgi:protein O-GlcNAc transferase